MARQMKDSGIEWIGDIPAHWQVSKIKYFVNCFDGKRVPIDSGKRISGLYPYWGAGSITDYVNDYLFDEELILLGEDGAPFFDYTRPVAFLVNEKIWVNNHIHVLKPHTDVSSAYMVHYLNNVDYKTYINGSVLNKLTQSNMNSIAFLVPPLTEQRRIAEFLDRKIADIDVIIYKTRATIEEYKLLKQSLITKAVTKGIHDNCEMIETEYEWIGNIPSTWKTIKAKWLLDERKERSEDGSEEPLSMSQKFGLIPTREMDIIPNMASSFVGAKRVYAGDLVFNKLKAHLGVFAVSKYDGLVSPDYAVYFSSGLANVKYLEYLFKTPQYIAEFRKKSSGVGAGLTRLYTDDLFSIYCSLPPMEEQKEIIMYLDKKCTEMDTLISRKTALLEEMESYKKSVIYEYVTGKKEVQ